VRNTVDKVRDTVGTVTDTVTNTVEQVLPEPPLDPAGRPVDPALIDQDANGARIVRGVVIAVALSDHGRRVVAALDIEVTRTETLEPLDLKVTTLGLPPGIAPVEAIKALRAGDPQGVYDFEHIYDPSGDAAAGASAPGLAPLPRDDIEIGMIDAGIDESHPALRDADIVAKATTLARRDAKPTAHGTAVASLLVGEDRDFRGALPGATLYAADAFAGSPTGGSAGDIARAIAWLVEEDVPVINISITGPKNALLEAAVRSALARGHVLVAPVGNDGPAAPVKYPAAYDGVIAVTSIDERRRIQIDANRGAAVAFAAPGVNIRAAQLGGAYGAVTGTSFASPIVAARFAELMSRADAALAAGVRNTLIAAADRPAKRQRDPTFGYGILNPRTTSGDLTSAQ
jgi:hypothetical protein